MSDSREPKLTVTTEGNRLTARFVNCRSLNEFTSDRIGQLLSGLAVDQPNQQVELDLANIEYLTSTVLGHLLGLHKRLAAAGGHLCLKNAGPAVLEVFKVTQLDQVLDIRPAA